ncbi:helicase HerA domain-containing protein [Frankia sp. AgPm24]|uniref:helicase HerA domain-containing protein n=1 Tax=Frankia sp. AgPm24 TaxID=631128 RepID=UPI00200E3FD9|nr:DUF87 domain-containing protein [Frankia sp. AgPm24]
MDALTALSTVKLDWVHGLEDVWQASPVHVDDVHIMPRQRILRALAAADTGRSRGILVQGQAGAGKTHMLNWVRQVVQKHGGYFFLIGPVGGDDFVESAVGAILSGLFQTFEGEIQVRRFLRRLCGLLGATTELAAALAGDTALGPTSLKDLIVAFNKYNNSLARQCQDTLCALVLFTSDDLDDRAVGETYLRSMEELEPGERIRRGIQPRTRNSREITRDLSRLLSLTGASVIAIDQVDGVIAEATARDSDQDGQTGGATTRLNMLADGLMVLQECTDRTLFVLTCLPAAWIAFRERAIASVQGRFEEMLPLNRLDDPAITAKIIERRFQENYDRVGFVPPYPTWPVTRAAFDQAPHFTPRELLQRINHHLEWCLSHGVVRELHDFATEDRAVSGPAPTVRSDGGDDGARTAGDGPDRRIFSSDVAWSAAAFTVGGGSAGQVSSGQGAGGLAEFDAEFAALRASVPSVTDTNEDNLMPRLLAAGLEAWIIENDRVHDYSLETSPSTRPPLHARLTRTLDVDTGEQMHWCFRAITAKHGNAILPRVTAACTSATIAADNPRRHLFLLRNGGWGTGAKVLQALDAFHAAGGRSLPLPSDDLATFAALHTLLDRRPPGLRSWLTTRRPASGTDLLRQALGSVAGAPGSGHLPTRPATPRDSAQASSEARESVESTARPEEGDHRIGDERGAQSSQGTAGTAPDPRPESAEFILGTAVRAGVPARLDLAVLRRHVAIFAGSGSGKTVLIRRLVEECALRGVSSIVLDPNNDLARMGDAWPVAPTGWRQGDADRATEYLARTDVVIWTPRRDGGRPLSFQPLPDFTGLRADPDEFRAAVDAGVATLAARAHVTGTTHRANVGRAILTAALRHFARGNRGGLDAFVTLLAELPDGVADELDPTGKRAAELAQALRAAMVNDPLFGGHGEPVDPEALLCPAPGRLARVSVISMVGLANDEQRQSFVNQLQLALFSWAKRNPAADRPLSALFVMDEAQTFAPSGSSTACTASTLALASQARKYGLGLVFATQAPKNLHNGIPGNATTQLFGRLNAPAQIEAARMMARTAGGEAADIGRLGVGEFYATSESLRFSRIRTPMCLSHHPAAPLTAEEVIFRARPQ